MVGGFDHGDWLAGALLAQEAAEPLLERLDPPRRAGVVLALLGITLVGVLLVICVMLGGRWVRRLARHEPRGERANDREQNRRLRESLAPILPKVDSNETIVTDAATNETKVDPK